MKNLLLALALLSSIPAITQTATPKIICGHDVFSQLVKNKYPAFEAAIQSTFESVRPQAGAVTDRNGPFTVNVVVHVLWNAAEENLADSVVLDQIAVLNRDYNRQNADTVNLREMFVPVAGNAQINFHLAAIERVHTGELFEVSLFGTDLLAAAKHSDQGGSDAWDTEHYLNIWVCKIQPLSLLGIELGQILGFAFPPAGLSNWPDAANAPTPEEDGVVIDFRAFGSNNPNTITLPDGNIQVVKGRTPVHEVGHYLGLRHIWGDGGLLGPNDCAQSDGIEDTPFANAQSNFDCDIVKNTCPAIETYYNQDMPDLVENYMDYSSEACQNMFTRQQVELMRNVLEGPRVGLLGAPSAVTALANEINWQIVPNPAADRAVVTFQAAVSDLRVVDAWGRMILQVTNPVSGFELNTQGWSNGVYFMQVQYGKRVEVRKVLIQQ